jgi:DNA-binding GntR family transcriptional regulator
MPAGSEELTTLSEDVASRLRRAILCAEFKPGESLPQRGLAREHGVSPIVMRESLRMLETEGLVENIPRWGSRVVPFSWEKLRGQYLVREALEGMVARLVSERVSGADADRIMSLAEAVDNLFNERCRDLEKLAFAHERLHQSIDLLCGSDELLAALKRISVQQLIWYTSREVNLRDVRQPDTWHRDLVCSIVAGDPDRAESAMRRHVRKGWNDLTKTRDADSDPAGTRADRYALPLDSVK